VYDGKVISNVVVVVVVGILNFSHRYFHCRLRITIRQRSIRQTGTRRVANNSRGAGGGSDSRSSNSMLFLESTKGSLL
jgi:hypothetical protein